MLTHAGVREEGYDGTTNDCAQSHVCVLSHLRLFASLWTTARQAPLPMEFSMARILEWVAIFFFRGSS